MKLLLQVGSLLHYSEISQLDRKSRARLVRFCGLFFYKKKLIICRCSKYRHSKKKNNLIPPRIELGTFCVLSRCHNQLDHATCYCKYSAFEWGRELGNSVSRDTIDDRWHVIRVFVAAAMDDSESSRLIRRVTQVNCSFLLFARSGCWSDLSMPVIYGSVVDTKTRCVHYHTKLDIVAIRCKCCYKFYPCFECHVSNTGLPPQVWAVQDIDEPSTIICGECKNELSIREYLGCNSTCPRCRSGFNPKCSIHYDLYFESSCLDSVNKCKK